MKGKKNKIIFAIITISLIALAFFLGENKHQKNNLILAEQKNADVKIVEKKEKKLENLKVKSKEDDKKSTDEESSEESTKEKSEETSKEIKVDNKKDEKVKLLDDESFTVYISVSCNTILDNMDLLNPEKIELVPKDGIIFPLKKVTAYKGESAFNVLEREMKANKIHLEFVNTPVYNSSYIEGINNLYEFDCGELSGWMYKVNNYFPGYGVSQYDLKADDKIEFLYTCDLGKDLGDQYFNAESQN